MSATFFYYDDGSLYSTWTQGTYACAQDTRDGNPAPSYSCPSTSGYYMYKNIGLTPNTIIVFSVKTNVLGNFYFLVNSTGAGQMYRIDTRANCISGFATTSNWTSWNAPSPGPTLLANTWYKFTIVMNSTSASLYYIQGTDISSRTETFGTLIGSYPLNNNGGYIGLVGDNAGIIYNTWWDNIIVRKYVSPEPSINIGIEQKIIGFSVILSHLAAFMFIFLLLVAAVIIRKNIFILISMLVILIFIARLQITQFADYMLAVFALIVLAILGAVFYERWRE
jgi:hypothetical protein